MNVKRAVIGIGVSAALVATVIVGGMRQYTARAEAMSSAPSVSQGSISTQNGVYSAKIAAPVASHQQGVAPSPTPEPTEAPGQPETADDTAQESTNEAAEQSALAAQAQVSQAQAEQIALAANPGTTVTHTSLGDENGTVVYEVELSNGSDVKVDATNGGILSSDQEGNEGSEQGETND